MGRYLGQHFLTNKAVIKKIIAAIEIEAADTIIEIGPGRGALTIPLAKKCGELNCKIIAIEKDSRLIENTKHQASGDVNFVVGDALKILPELVSRYPLLDTKYKLIGNIPYYITGKLLRTIGELKNKPSLTVLTIQKEVAERICAKSGEMNLLAASIQVWATPKILFILKPNDFLPPPKVNSAVIRLKTDAPRLKNEKYYEIIKVVFRQPRKTLLNNLVKGLKISKEKGQKLIKWLGYKENARPQDLTVKNLLNLSEVL